MELHNFLLLVGGGVIFILIEKYIIWSVLKV